MENTFFSGFIAGPCCQDNQQLLAELWTPEDWLPYLPDLNLLDLSICSVLQTKGQARPHANLTVLCIGCTASSRPVYGQLSSRQVAGAFLPAGPLSPSPLWRGWDVRPHTTARAGTFYLPRVS
jgi:hypothetical protein